MADDGASDRGRAAFARRDWAMARTHFLEVPELSVADQADLATACFWLGRAEDAIRTNQAVHRRCLAEGATSTAALVALIIGYCESLRGHEEAGAGWLARSRRLFEEAPESPERGYLLCVDAELACRAGQFDRARQLADRLLDLGERYGEPTFQAHGLFTHGLVAVAHRRMDEARGWLDEAALPVQAGSVRPEWAGNLYCRMIRLCHETADLPRAQYWTELTEQWCAGYAPGAMFSGICRVHRVQLREVQGEWVRGLAEAERAASELEHLDVVVAAEAHFRLGELRRLLGDLDAAEAAYRRAHEMGFDPLPGLALLHLRRGHSKVAVSILDAALTAEHPPLGRAPMLAARAEVALAEHDTDTAGRCVRELTTIAADFDSPGRRATAEHWHGALLHAQGRDADAVGILRTARGEWQRMHAPYEVARTRAILAEVSEALGDQDTADQERGEAEAAMTRLGARRDADRLRAREHRRGPGELSPREVEVIATIAGGISNREAAAELRISERTVARHLANIYLKTDTSSRTGAVAWARERGLC